MIQFDQVWSNLIQFDPSYQKAVALKQIDSIAKSSLFLYPKLETLQPIWP